MEFEVIYILNTHTCITLTQETVDQGDVDYYHNNCVEERN